MMVIDTEFIPCYPFKTEYPGSFHKNVLKILDKQYNEGLILSVPCGIFKRSVNVDLNPAVKPCIIGDILHLPFRDHVFKITISDPPYSYIFSDRLYHGRKMRQSVRLFRELERVTRETIVFLNWYIAHFRKPFQLTKVYVCDHGGTHRLRALTIAENKNSMLV